MLPRALRYWRSSCSWRVRIALAAKGLAFDYRAVNILEGVQRGDEHSDRNPLMQVPVLECDDLLTGSRIRLTQVTP